MLELAYICRIDRIAGWKEIHFQHWMDSIVIVFLGFYLERIIECSFVRIKRTETTGNWETERPTGRERVRWKAKIVRFNLIRFEWLFHISYTVPSHCVYVFDAFGLNLPVSPFQMRSIFPRHKLLPLSDAKWNVQLQHRFESLPESILCFMPWHQNV